MFHVIFAGYVCVSVLALWCYGVDLVWSDPEEVDTWAVSPRGAGWLFGNKVTNEVRLLQFHLSVCLSVCLWLSVCCCSMLWCSSTWWCIMRWDYCSSICLYVCLWLSICCCSMLWCSSTWWCIHVFVIIFSTKAVIFHFTNTDQDPYPDKMWSIFWIFRLWWRYML